jgi:hypothetical protein
LVLAAVDGGVRLDAASQNRHVFESFTFHLPTLCDQCQQAMAMGGVKCTGKRNRNSLRTRLFYKLSSHSNESTDN